MEIQQKSGQDRIVKPEIKYVNMERFSSILEYTIIKLQEYSPLDLFETIQTKRIPGNDKCPLNSIEMNLVSENYNIGLFTIIYSHKEKNDLRSIVGGRETGHFLIEEEKDEDKYVNLLHEDKEAITPEIRSQVANTKDNLIKRLINHQNKINQEIDTLYKTAYDTEGHKMPVEIDISKAHEPLDPYCHINF